MLKWLDVCFRLTTCFFYCKYSMGESLMQVLEETIPKSMTPAVKEAWKETYQELSGDMIKGFTMVRRGSS